MFSNPYSPFYEPTTFKFFGVNYYALVTVVITIIIIIIIPENSIWVNVIEFGKNFPLFPDGSETQPASYTVCTGGSFPAIELPWHVADILYLSSAEFKE